MNEVARILFDAVLPVNFRGGRLVFDGDSHMTDNPLCSYTLVEVLPNRGSLEGLKPPLAGIGGNPQKNSNWAGGRDNSVEISIRGRLLRSQ